MAVIQERRGSVVSRGSEREDPASAIGHGGVTVGVRGLLGLSVPRLEWALVAVRAAWVLTIVLLAVLTVHMESVRVVWLTAGPIIVLYSVGVVVLLRRGAVRDAALLGIALDAVVVTAILPAVVFLASRDDPADLTIAAQPALAVIALTGAISALRLRLLPAAVLGLFLIVVPAMLAGLAAQNGTGDIGLQEGAVRIAFSVLVFGLLGRVLQHSRLELVQEVAETQRRRDEAERRADERDVLAEIGRIISASPDIRETYERFVDEVRAVLPADRVAITIYEPADDTLTTTYVSGLDVPGWEEGARRPSAGSPLRQAIQERRGLLLDADAYRQRAGYDSVAAGIAAGVRTAIIVPLEHRGAVIGTLSLRSRDPVAYAGGHLDLLDRIGRQIAPVVGTARLYAEMERSARERDVFAEIARVLSASPEIDDVYEAFASQVSRVLPFQRISINTQDWRTGRLRRGYVAGVPVPGLPTSGLRPAGNRGVLDAVVRDQRPLILPDIAKVLDRFPDARHVVEAGIRCGIYVPLISNGQFVATLAVGATTPNAYTEADLDLLARIGGQIAGTVANAELRARAGRNAREEAALAEIGRIVNSSLDLAETYDQFVDRVRSLIPADRVTVGLVDPDTGDLALRHIAGRKIEGEVHGAINLRRPGGLLDGIVASGVSRRVENVKAAAGEFPELEPFAAAGLNSAIYTPLIAEGRVMGVLAVLSGEAGIYGDADTTLLDRVAGQIAGTLNNVALHERADRQAREESVLAEIGRIINSSLDTDGVYEQFAEQVGRILAFDRLVISRRGPGDDSFTIAHLTGAPVSGLEVGTVWKSAESPLARVLEAGETVFLNAPTITGNGRPVPGESEGILSSLVVPLIAREQPIGFLSVRSRKSRAYTEADAALARRIATLASSALTNADLYEAAEREARERAVLAEIGRIVTSSLDIERVYSAFAVQVRKLIDFDRITISHVDERRRAIVYGWGKGMEQTGFGVRRVIPLEAFAGTRLGRVMAEEKPAIFDARDIEELHASLSWDQQSTTESVIAIPLISEDRVIGGLAIISNRQDAYGERDLEIGSRVGDQVAGAVANSLLHAALQDASEELKDTAAQKAELMTTVAHELRSPLTALRAYMDLVLDGTAGDVPAQQRDLLLRAGRSTARLQNLLNVFAHLEMAEDQEVPLTVTSIKLESIVSSAVEVFSVAADDAGVAIATLGFEGAPIIEGDRQAIEQVVANLLSNAIKYSPAGGRVELRCEVGDSEVVVSVRDQGLGVPEADRERLFERFYRGTDPAKLAVRGTGLGLYVSKGLVERHHGRVWFECGEPDGSVFHFALPFQQPD